MTGRFEKNHPRRFLGSGHLGNPLEKKSDEKINLTALVNQICVHDEYCTVRKTLDKAHCSKDYAKDCQIAKFYNRYGEAGNQMGVGL